MLNLNDLFGIPFMKGYAIARNGNVFNVVTGAHINPVGSTHVIVKIPENSNNSYSVARLLMETLIILEKVVCAHPILNIFGLILII